jgi:hypothetical protein
LKYETGVNLHAIGIGRENSYVATPYYGEGKTYAALTGNVQAVHHGIGSNIDHLNPTRPIGYAACDEMLGDNLDNGLNIRAEANFYRATAQGGYSHDPQQRMTVEGLTQNINQHIKAKLTINGFVNCYKLVVGTTIDAGIDAGNYNNPSINDSCNLRVFELFSSVVIAEVHRNSYTSIINAAMLDLFKTPNEEQKSQYANAFYKFFGDEASSNRHNMAFSGATKTITSMSAPGWYAATANGIVIVREMVITENWLKLLHNYECWLLMNQKVDGINGGANYDGTNDNHRKFVNFDEECNDGLVSNTWHPDWSHLRTSFKIYAAYQAAKHLNGWHHRDNGHDNDIGDKLGHNNVSPDDMNLETQGGGINNALYTSITQCIQTAVGNNGGCEGKGKFPANGQDDINHDALANQQQEVCLDILCGLLQQNYLDYN